MAWCKESTHLRLPPQICYHSYILYLFIHLLSVSRSQISFFGFKLFILTQCLEYEITISLAYQALFVCDVASFHVFLTLKNLNSILWHIIERVCNSKSIRLKLSLRSATAAHHYMFRPDPIRYQSHVKLNNVELSWNELCVDHVLVCHPNVTPSPVQTHSHMLSIRLNTTFRLQPEDNEWVIL